MNHVFADVPKMNIPRSVFRRPCGIKTTIGANFLYPIYCDEVLPGDTFTMSAKFFGRLATPVCPIMDDLYLDTFFFAVPVRLIDANWKKIMGESTATNPTTETFAETNCPVMHITADAASVHSIHDYLGLPIGVEMDILPYWHRAYNLIYNEWFRDENLSPYAVVGGNTPESSGTESPSHYVLRVRSKAQDYYTSALPWPLRGNPVNVPVGQTAPVYGTTNSLPFILKSRDTASGTFAPHTNLMYPKLKVMNPSVSSDSMFGVASFRRAGVSSDYTYDQLDNSSAVGISSKSQVKSAIQAGYIQDSGLYADLTEATGVSVNLLREAIATQHFLERSAVGGSRYVETILAHFGVRSPDARMQRPEYLGGSSSSLNVNSVPQTSSTDATSPQGSLAAFVTGSSECFWTKSFTEHCVILGIVNIHGINSYQQGIPRMFSRRSRFDFYWPEFANLGEQTVLNKEIYAQGTSDDNGVFGYQERWAEYRYNPNRITSAMRSTAPLTLDYWHLAEKFTSLPTLSHNFIKYNTPVQRVLAVNTNAHEQFILDGYIDLKCARPMPVYSVPGLNRL